MSDYPILVVAAVIIRNGHVLLEQRAPSGTERDGLWDLPGGKVECGEEPRVAVIREIREELRVGVTPQYMVPELRQSVWHFPEGDKHWIIAAYYCTLESGEPVCHERLKWVHLCSMYIDRIMRPDLDFIRSVAWGIGAPCA
jgi:8-oxo-dGTP diphosphatase